MVLPLDLALIGLGQVDAFGVEEAQRELQEILISTAPWFRVSSNAWHDDQPLNRLALGLEAGWFATPLTEFTARFQPMPYRFDGSSRTVGIAEAAVTRRMPAVRLDTELAAGGIRRPQGGGSWNWTGRAAMGLHLPAHVTLRARVERTPYLSTGASLNTPVMVQTVTGTLHWDGARGWLGEASYQRQRYPDDNASRTAYGWLLAPLIFREHLEIQGGYAAAASNAKSSRFVLVRPNQPYAPSDPRFDTTGHYAPYYTPSHLVTHSAIAALTLRNGRRTTFRTGGAYAVRATDDAPFFDVSGGGALRSTYSRQFSPWNIHASLKIDVRDHFTIEPSGEIGHSAFYSWATSGFQITYHFTTGAVRRASAP